MNWNLTAELLPTEGQKVRTKIDDGRGLRMQGILLYQHNLWWVEDGSMYVYYTPTHWRPLS